MPRLPPYSRRRIHLSPALPPPSVCVRRGLAVGTTAQHSCQSRSAPPLSPAQETPLQITASPGRPPPPIGPPRCPSSLTRPPRTGRSEPRPSSLVRPLIGWLAKDCCFLLALPLPLWRAARSARRCPPAPRAGRPARRGPALRGVT